MMQQVDKSLHLIRDELARWRKILDVPVPRIFIVQLRAGTYTDE
jgi:hypothetical protein